MRSLCLGLGPAVFGFIFYLFHVNLNKESNKGSNLTPHFINGSEIITETPVPVRSIGVCIFLVRSKYNYVTLHICIDKVNDQRNI